MAVQKVHQDVIVVDGHTVVGRGWRKIYVAVWHFLYRYVFSVCVRFAKLDNLTIEAERQFFRRSQEQT